MRSSDKVHWSLMSRRQASRLTIGRPSFSRGNLNSMCHFQRGVEYSYHTTFRWPQSKVTIPLSEAASVIEALLGSQLNCRLYLHSFMHMNLHLQPQDPCEIFQGSPCTWSPLSILGSAIQTQNWNALYASTYATGS